MEHRIRNKGFTLIELSIVFVVIGLVVAGIVGGQHIVRTSQIQKMVADISQYKTSIQAFKTAYKAMPGDMRDATSYWPSTTNGDGDWVINMEDENLFAWEHMVNAGVVSYTETSWLTDPGQALTELASQFIGIPSAFAECTEVTPGNEIPPTAGIKQGGYFLTEAPEPVHGKTGNAIVVGTLEGNVAPAGMRGPIVAPQEAYRIDKKLDDGVANTGHMMGEKGITSLHECLNASNDYDTRDDSTSACYMVFWL